MGKSRRKANRSAEVAKVVNKVKTHEKDSVSSVNETAVESEVRSEKGNASSNFRPAEVASQAKPAMSSTKSTSTIRLGRVNLAVPAISLRPNVLKYVTWVLIVTVTFILVDFAVQYINNDYSIAMVNGKRIARSEYLERLDEAYGSVIATQMINEAIIMQEAEAADVTVDDEEVDNIVNRTKEEIGGEEALNAALQANGLTLETYKKNLRIQLLAEKIIVKEPTDEELTKFIEEFGAQYFGDEVSLEEDREEIERAYVSQKFGQLSSTWLASLRANAAVTNNTETEPTYGILKLTRQAIADFNSKDNDSDKSQKGDGKESGSDKVVEKSEEMTPEDGDATE